MLKRTINYVDFNDEPQSEDFYFHLTEAEIVELEFSKKGGMKAWLDTIVAAEDGPSIMEAMKKIILTAYGQKSVDGKRFIKNQELRDEFESTAAYSALFMEMVTEPDSAATFAAGLVPKNVAEAAQKIASVDLTVVPKPETIKNYTRQDFAAMGVDEMQTVMKEVADGTATIEDRTAPTTLA